MEGTLSTQPQEAPRSYRYYCTVSGAILVPSGRKLTVGQQRRRRQRGGAAGDHWSAKLLKGQRIDYVRKAGGETPASEAGALAEQFQRVVTERHGDNPNKQLEGYLAWKASTGGPISPDRVAKLTQAAEAAATPRRQVEPSGRVPTETSVALKMCSLPPSPPQRSLLLPSAKGTGWAWKHASVSAASAGHKRY